MEWHRVKKRCTRRRFLEGEDDAAFPHHETQAFKVDEQVSITEPYGQPLTFLVAADA